MKKVPLSVMRHSNGSQVIALNSHLIKGEFPNSAKLLIETELPLDRIAEAFSVSDLEQMLAIRRKTGKDSLISTAYLLLNNHGTVIGVYPDEESMVANHPYSDGYEPKNPQYRIAEVRMFNDHSHNTAIQLLIHLAKDDPSGRIYTAMDT